MNITHLGHIEIRRGPGGATELNAADTARELPSAAPGVPLADRNHDGWLSLDEATRLGSGLGALLHFERPEWSNRLAALADLAELKAAQAPEYPSRALFVARFLGNQNTGAHGENDPVVQAQSLRAAAGVLDELDPALAGQLRSLATRADGIQLRSAGNDVSGNDPYREFLRVGSEASHLLEEALAKAPYAPPPAWATRYDPPAQDSLWDTLKELG